MEINKHVKNTLKVINRVLVQNVVLYDVRTLTPFYDYTIIATISNYRQGNAAITYLRQSSDEIGLNVRNYSGGDDAKWFLVDLGEIVVHLFVQEERQRYNLDGLLVQTNHTEIDLSQEEYKG